VDFSANIAVDLAAGAGVGPIWGTASADLNATLLSWRPGQGVDEHVNEQCDVLLVVVAGSGRITVDGDGNELRPGLAVLVEKGRARAIEAGTEGLRYLSVHVRRAPLQRDL
jgi:mannose-6-phosphate isomerase-like protein (cupin superfamily)